MWCFVDFIRNMLLFFVRKFCKNEFDVSILDRMIRVQRPEARGQRQEGQRAGKQI